MRRARSGTWTRGRQAGFTLFEMVVVICLIVLLYMVAEERLNEMPAAAERAGFQAVVAQLKTGLNLQMLAAVSAGDMRAAEGLAGANPMDLMLETPGNYRGEVDSLNQALQRSSWYYDRSRGELVYVVGESSMADVRVIVAGTPVSPGLIRLKIANAYGAGDSRTSTANGGSGSGGNWQGLLLVPVFPFEWESRPVEPVEI